MNHSKTTQNLLPQNRSVQCHDQHRTACFSVSFLSVSFFIYRRSTLTSTRSTLNGMQSALCSIMSILIECNLMRLLETAAGRDILKVCALLLENLFFACILFRFTRSQRRMPKMRFTICNANFSPRLNSKIMQFPFVRWFKNRYVK